ncbi:MAG: phospholipase [Ruminococcaceae bacterium]|nr:phospholipase [Oscillospiraceae bacterium]
MKIIYEDNKDYGFKYVANIPDNISQNPAILFQLHGAGERGEDLNKVFVHGLCNVVNDINLTDCILISPLCPENTFWAAKVESLKTFIDNIIEKYSADKNRIYLCGLSMGGFGTWYTAMAYPDLFAAIAPCCGGGMPWNANVLKMPVWAFHGMLDTTVLPSNTIDMVNALKQHNPNVKCTLYEDVAHNSWTRAFTPELLEWILTQHK